MIPDRIEAVVFDLDGTLLDHTGSVTAALTAWLPELGTRSDASLVAAWLDVENRHLPAWRSGSISFAEQRRRRLRDFLPLLGLTPGDDEQLDAVFAGYLDHYARSWTSFDDVEPTLGRLDLPLAVLTNGTERQQRAKLAALGLTARIGPVFTAEGLGVAKPDRAAYLAACAGLGVEPHVALHVGDRYDLDVIAARAAGLKAVHLDRVGSGPLDEPSRITTLASLPGLLH